jgi:hypothetical protein
MLSFFQRINMLKGKNEIDNIITTQVLLYHFDLFLPVID